MRQGRTRWSVFAALMVLLFTAAACGAAPAAEQVARAVSPVPPTASPTPLPTWTPSAMPTPLATRTPTATPTPTSLPTVATATPMPFPTPRPSATVKPYPADQVLWRLTVAEGDTGEWCEGQVSKAHDLVEDHIKDAARTYRGDPQGFTVYYTVDAHAADLPEGATMRYDNDAQHACVEISRPLPPGEYAGRFFMRILITSPQDYPPVAHGAPYLLLSVLPNVDTSDRTADLLALHVGEVLNPDRWTLQVGGVAVLNPDGPALTVLAPDDAVRLHWSPDGARLAYLWGSAQQIVTLNADGSGRATVPFLFYDPDWSADGRMLAYAAYADSLGTLAVWISDADGSSAVRMVEGERPQWSPAATEIAYLIGDELWLYGETSAAPVRLATGVSAVMHTLGQDLFRDFAWSPNGQSIAYVSTAHELTVVDRAGGTPRRVADLAGLESSSNSPSVPTWSPDGKWIALNCDGLCVASLDGTVEKVPNVDWVNSMAWSRDGSWLYLVPGDGGVWRYDVATRQLTPVLVDDFHWYGALETRPGP